jgi:hypothetical protein
VHFLPRWHCRKGENDAQTPQTPTFHWPINRSGEGQIRDTQLFSSSLILSLERRGSHLLLLECKCGVVDKIKARERVRGMYLYGCSFSIRVK